MCTHNQAAVSLPTPNPLFPHTQSYTALVITLCTLGGSNATTSWHCLKSIPSLPTLVAISTLMALLRNPWTTRACCCTNNTCKHATHACPDGHTPYSDNVSMQACKPSCDTNQVAKMGNLHAIALDETGRDCTTLRRGNVVYRVAAQCAVLCRAVLCTLLFMVRLPVLSDRVSPRRYPERSWRRMLGRLDSNLLNTNADSCDGATQAGWRGRREGGREVVERAGQKGQATHASAAQGTHMITTQQLNWGQAVQSAINDRLIAVCCAPHRRMLWACNAGQAQQQLAPRKH